MILSEQKAEIEKIKANLVQQHRTLQERTLKLAGAIEAMQLVEQKFAGDDEDEEEDIVEDEEELGEEEEVVIEEEDDEDALIEVNVSDSDNI